MMMMIDRVTFQTVIIFKHRVDIIFTSYGSHM